MIRIAASRDHHVLQVMDIHLGEIGDHTRAIVLRDELGRIGEHRAVRQHFLHAHQQLFR
jgi:hypothetical protein